jgi:hypothetical protein
LWIKDFSSAATGRRWGAIVKVAKVEKRSIFNQIRFYTENKTQIREKTLKVRLTFGALRAAGSDRMAPPSTLVDWFANAMELIPGKLTISKLLIWGFCSL